MSNFRKGGENGGGGTSNVGRSYCRAADCPPTSTGNLLSLHLKINVCRHAIFKLYPCPSQYCCVHCVCIGSAGPLDFVSYQENIDTSSPLGSAIFTIISAVAQLERDIIAERVKAGLRRAKENGKQLGRPRVEVDLEQIQQMRSQGLSLRAIAKKVGVSRTTVADILRQ